MGIENGFFEIKESFEYLVRIGFLIYPLLNIPKNHVCIKFKTMEFPWFTLWILIINILQRIPCKIYLIWN